jgi:hypothetical protein
VIPILHKTTNTRAWYLWRSWVLWVPSHPTLRIQRWYHPRPGQRAVPRLLLAHHQQEEENQITSSLFLPCILSSKACTTKEGRDHRVQQKLQLQTACSRRAAALPVGCAKPRVETKPKFKISPSRNNSQARGVVSFSPAWTSRGRSARSTEPRGRGWHRRLHRVPS